MVSGVYEAQFGNSNYPLLWKSRVGFARVALDAKVVRDVQFYVLYDINAFKFYIFKCSL